MSADPADLKKYSDARSSAARKQADRDAAMRTLLGSVEGRALLNWHIEMCHILTQDFTPDPYRTAFACGERNIGLRWMAELQRISPNDLIKMMRENSPDKEVQHGRSDDSDSTSADE